MQALMNFKEDLSETIVGHEDMQEEIKEILKNFHSNLLMLQQVVEVCLPRMNIPHIDLCSTASSSTIPYKRKLISIKWILMNSIHSSHVC